jgi:hypothetical protein
MSASNVIRFLLRIPTTLRDELQEVAEREHRSLNAQIVHILERYAEEQRAETDEGKAAA